MGVFKKALLAGLGAVSLSQERTKEIVEELVKAGKLKEKEGEKLFDELMSKATVAKKDLEGKLGKQVLSSVGKLNLAALEQLKKLERRIQELEKGQAKPRPAAGAKKKTAKKAKG